MLSHTAANDADDEVLLSYNKEFSDIAFGRIASATFKPATTLRMDFLPQLIRVWTEQLTLSHSPRTAPYLKAGIAERQLLSKDTAIRVPASA